jgi:outer membrane lipoprotein-sorting protein
MIKFFLSIVVVTSLSLFTVGSETSEDSQHRLNQLIDLLGTHGSYRLAFIQLNQGPMNGRAIQAEGFLTIEKPDKFEWLYTTTPQNRIVSDGTHIVMLMPDTRQVMIDTAELHQMIWSPVAILTREHLAKYFRVELLKETEESTRYRFYPKQDNQPYEYIETTIFADHADGLFSTMIMDAAGSANTLTFSNLFVPDEKMDIKLPDFPDNYDVTDFHGNPVNISLEKETCR